MKVLRHQHPADHQKPGFLAELAQRLDKDPAEALIRKQPAAAIGAGGDKLQLAGLKMASVDRHTWGIHGISADMAIRVSRRAGLALRQPGRPDQPGRCLCATRQASPARKLNGIPSLTKDMCHDEDEESE